MSQYDLDEYSSKKTAAHIANLTSAVSKTLYKLITGQDKVDLPTDVDLVTIKSILSIFLKEE